MSVARCSHVLTDAVLRKAAPYFQFIENSARRQQRQDYILTPLQRPRSRAASTLAMLRVGALACCRNNTQHCRSTSHVHPRPLQKKKNEEIQLK